MKNIKYLRPCLLRQRPDFYSLRWTAFFSYRRALWIFLYTFAVCIAFNQISSYAEEEEAKGPCTDIVTGNMDSLSKFLKSTSKYWSNGIIYGQFGNACRRGLIVKTNEMDFFEGAGTTQGDERFMPTRTPVSTYDDDLFSDAQQSSPDEPVIVSYVHPFPLYPFHLTDTKYWIQKIEPMKRSFTETESFQEIGNQFIQPKGVRHGLYGQGRKRGKIRHVSRWGMFFGKMCTCYLHEGGMEKIREKAGNKSYVTTQRPKVTPLNIFSEKGCKFAEDAVSSQATVSVGYSQKLFDLWNAYPHIVRDIKVESGLYK